MVKFSTVSLGWIEIFCRISIQIFDEQIQLHLTYFKSIMQ